MNNKTKIALIVTLVSIFLCACPGIIVVLVGSGISLRGDASALAIAAICIGAIMVLIPVAGGIYTWVQSRRSADLEDVEVPPPL